MLSCCSVCALCSSRARANLTETVLKAHSVPAVVIWSRCRLVGWRLESVVQLRWKHRLCSNPSATSHWISSLLTVCSYQAPIRIWMLRRGHFWEGRPEEKLRRPRECIFPSLERSLGRRMDWYGLCRSIRDHTNQTHQACLIRCSLLVGVCVCAYMCVCVRARSLCLSHCCAMSAYLSPCLLRSLSLPLSSLPFSLFWLSFSLCLSLSVCISWFWTRPILLTFLRRSGRFCAIERGPGSCDGALSSPFLV